MRVELPVLSFVSATSLFILVPFCLKSRNLPFFFLIAWLLFCNIIQGVNAIVWANNVLPHAPVWCDIVTPLTFAVRVALPATALCLCRHLEMISSSLDISYDYRSKYFTPVCHCLMSILVPVVYIGLHLIVQHERFTIVEDFGCEASIYPSIPAILIVWPLPLLLCSFTLVYATLAIYNYRRRCAFFSQHLHPRSTVTKTLFLRLVSVSISIIFVVVLVTIFDMTSRLESGLRPWTSWNSVHSWAGSQSIDIISALDKSSAASRSRVRTGVEWGFVPLLSIVLVAMMGSAHDVRNTNTTLLKALRDRFSYGSKSDFDLPIQQPREPALDERADSYEDHLGSHWDDTVRSRRAFISLPIRSKPKLEPIEIPAPWMSPPLCPKSDDSDASFMAATLTYLGSPTGKEALGQRAVVTLAPLQDAHTKPLSPQYPVSPATTYPSLMPPPRTKRPRDNELSLTSQFPLPPDTQPKGSLTIQSSSPGPRRARSNTFGSVNSAHPSYSTSPVSPTGRSKPLLSPRSIRQHVVPAGED